MWKTLSLGPGLDIYVVQGFLNPTDLLIKIPLCVYNISNIYILKPKDIYLGEGDGGKSQKDEGNLHHFLNIKKGVTQS